MREGKVGRGLAPLLLREIDAVKGSYDDTHPHFWHPVTMGERLPAANEIQRLYDHAIKVSLTAIHKPTSFTTCAEADRDTRGVESA